MTLEPEYTYEEVAEILRMSPRWVRARVKDGAEHQRYGHKVRFTESQIEKLRASHATNAVQVKQSVTTGRRRTR